MHGRIARICTSFIDVPDKIAVAIYFAGCSLRCKGCQNSLLWDPQGGTLMHIDEVFKKVVDHPLAQAIVFLGGEPTDQLDFLIPLSQKIKKSSNRELALYTGREFEILPQDLIDCLNLIVCGPYRLDLQQRGWPASSNQRILKKEAGQWQC